MPNIIDYLKWRGDLSFEEAKINEVDNLILARISYLPFEKIEFKEKQKFSEFGSKFLKLNNEDFNQIDDLDLVKELISSARYKDLVFSDYFEKIDETEQMQFASICIGLPNDEIFISFRGTDATLVGWKENFNMSFMTNIPSQLEATKYLDKISDKYSKKKLRIGGHSKGGNIAVYSSIFCKENVQERIIEVTNADGPGFGNEVIETDEYKRILNRIHTYIPQSSVIGRLLEHEEKYQVIQSTQTGIMQHDIYSWQVMGKSIISISEVTSGSEVVNKIIRDWLKKTTPKQRKNFSNIIYDTLIATQITTVHEISSKLIKNLGMVIDSYKNISKEDKKEMKEMIKLLFVSVKDVMKNEMNLNKKE